MDSDAFKVLEKYCRRRYRHGSAHYCAETSTANFGSDFHKISSDFLANPSPFQSAQNIVEVIDSLSQKSDERSRCCRAFIWFKNFHRKYGLKYISVIVLTIAFAFLGGLMFYHLEAQAENDRIENMNKIIRQRQENLVSEINSLVESPSCFKQKTDPFEPLNARCKKKLLALIKDYSENIIFENCGPETKWVWDYWNAVFFALSLMTTIGYGNMSCKTYEGRIATILYSLFGIPIMLIMLNSIGHFFFNNLQALWENVRRCIKRKTRRFRRWVRRKSVDGENPEEKVNEDSDMDSEQDIFQTYPLYLALAIVFIYIMLCSFVLRIWEEWDWFTAFYFLSISLTTIGLGDEMPEHPHYASCFFIFFIIGLSLVSMCITMLQMRVENRYMQALQLIDEQRQTLFSNIRQKVDEVTHNGNATSEPVVELADEQSNSNNAGSKDDANMLGVRWRGAGRFSSKENPFSDPFFSSPILQTLLRYSHSSDPRTRLSAASVQSIAPPQRAKPSGAPLAESENIDDVLRERL
uniref:TWiK family of potassium channels protein 18 n=1 Tax=Bursaphelenchus xylophilus TaxID=6326 RepID=A0A1I7SQP2_BURXY